MRKLSQQNHIYIGLKRFFIFLSHLCTFISFIFIMILLITQVLFWVQIIDLTFDIDQPRTPSAAALFLSRLTTGSFTYYILKF